MDALRIIVVQNEPSVNAAPSWRAAVYPSTDQRLRRLSGKEVARRGRAHSAARGSPSIVSTAAMHTPLPSWVIRDRAVSLETQPMTAVASKRTSSWRERLGAARAGPRFHPFAPPISRGRTSIDRDRKPSAFRAGSGDPIHRRRPPFGSALRSAPARGGLKLPAPGFARWRPPSVPARIPLLPKSL